MRRQNNASLFCRAILTVTLLIVAVGATAGVASPRPAVVRTLVDVLERRFQRAEVDDWSAVTGLVVPGGNPRRIEEAMRLAQLYPHLKIILGSPGEYEASLARDSTGGLAPNVTLEQISVNTYGNAVVAKQLIGPKPGEKWLLVTSASHMPRAIGSFHRIGFFVDPWPVHDSFDNTTASLAEIARHEWLGLLAYWVQGRTIAMFPSRTDLRVRDGRSSPNRVGA